MARPQRVELMKSIGQKRGSVVISYVTGDRENVSTRIAPDVVRIIFRHLKISKVE